MSLNLPSLNHVARPTRRLEESRRFYREVIGMREVSRPPFSFNGAWLLGSGIQMHLIEDDRAPDPSEQWNTRGTHIAFATDDIDETERRLQAMGVPYIRQAIPDWNVPQIYIKDPDGHLIEIGVYRPLDY
jgi:catechol 2,3-dioxygenase-like lactoylglutathione lyase family enzyme